ncbi:FecR domain-containing protein [Porphyromonadaceae bacterium OttesenSCG-928-L07]|nr:FecR domain-containing protein [Porphyromonadaceae bacterium OttesenSCG-928-L07]MDL2251641.1 FecR domain-containing protein [Odoribacter sp. OttesenSCG-928-J03]
MSNKKSNNPVNQIIKLFFSDNYTGKDKEEIMRWLIEDNHTSEKEEALMECWNTLEAGADKSVYTSLEQVKLKLGMKVKKSVPFYRYILRVAAITLPLTLLAGGYFYINKPTRSTQVTKLLEVSVPHGDQEKLHLADGSQVWLNAGTEIKYPDEMSRNERLVHLTGEAYFNVKSDRTKPFIVKTKNLSVTVIGTEFNVRDYPNEGKTRVTLNTGKVNLETVCGKRFTLEPGQELVYDHRALEAYIVNIETANASEWKSGKLIFNHTPFCEIIQTLERHFNVSFDIDDSLAINQQYSVKFVDHEEIHEIMDIMKDIVGDCSYEINGNKIKILKD